ncbi:acetylxylan esterase [Propionibacteriaceae bacterium Y2011]
MAHFDLPLDKLHSYRPDLSVPDDLQSFWERTLAEARGHDLALRVEQIDNRLTLVDTYDLTFAGFDGSPVRGWLHVPAGTTEALPTVATYKGYSGGRGFPHADNVYVLAGYAQLVLDTRGQSYGGGGWEVTPDTPRGAAPNHVPGQMTRGILDPENYYYRRVYTDALRLLDVAAALPQCDTGRLAVAGGSQGGGITIAVAGLAALTGIELVGSAPDVPFLCDFPRATTLVNTLPYEEIARYLKAFRDHVEPAFWTLSYFDGAILGRWATAPTSFSVGLMDTTCPPSTCFAAYNWYGDGHVTDRDMQVYSFNGHEGGGDYRKQQLLDWLKPRLA